MVGPPVVVGIDGSDWASRAVAWAAGEAAARHAPLTVVHATGVPGVAARQDWLEASHRDARAMLDRAAEVAARVAPGIRVRRKVSDASPVEALTELSKTARLVVVGCTGRGAVGDALLGSVPLGLVGRSFRPVAVVRGRLAVVGAPVAVGLDGGTADQDLLAVAFDEAAVRRAQLVVVHALGDWEAARAFNLGRTRECARERALAESVSGWREKYPDVPVQLVSAGMGPRHQLLRWSQVACLLVVGTGRRAGLHGAGFGSVNHVLIHHADCPVLVVPGTGA
ncbi:universal stress protein [Amycolatopsis suaedae]|uniref:universal stress protein n=1 Tax=Amycolatopsis suaedae TaxID=2510978 RepID=UPI0013EF5402|nr:universal stress protein [Amycolatopsis suaedae]